MQIQDEGREQCEKWVFYQALIEMCQSMLFIFVRVSITLFKELGLLGWKKKDKEIQQQQQQQNTIREKTKGLRN